MAYVKPQLDLLSAGEDVKTDDRTNAVQKGKSIAECLAAHNISVEPDGFKESPINMVFDYRLKAGTRYKDVLSIVTEISVAVGSDVKIFHDNEDGNVFSVSVPHPCRDIVTLRQILESYQYLDHSSPLTIAVGIDDRGRNVCFDLCEAPHLLISGTTGSGKTVFLDDVILSILYKASPNDVRLVLIDPEGNDFKLYDTIPHLMFPVVTEKAKAVEVVKYVRNQMNKRFDSFAEVGVKNIEAYNSNAAYPLPRIVIVIDKYMEMTYEVPEDFEDCLEEIARKGRAAGVHIIINTQTARSDVVSSDLKFNIKYRAAFSVTDWHESKAILDKTGAQKLLGNGDMYLTFGQDDSILHVQAANVTEDEVRKIVQKIIADNGTADFVGKLDYEKKDLNEDEQYIRKILLSVSNTKSISVFTIQKTLGVGFSEASDIIKFLEEKKVISSFAIGKGRTVDQDRIDELLGKYQI